ncbi:hypothetical protein GYMLUDRAFT_63935 [Collybiopsis luxurians FD-317 M1]|uniref:Uncharacterized protein n=1 Tax=Collybiopsis luxurians FD-317 M1 TaxID=944289 RepID=A0A0D0C557_9AGAR|nr:hypothetical protein GYMLUDRAFT_63935 [Collybiopsis luxurians FD-317 M1]
MLSTIVFAAPHSFQADEKAIPINLNHRAAGPPLPPKEQLSNNPSTKNDNVRPPPTKEKPHNESNPPHPAANDGPPVPPKEKLHSDPLKATDHPKWLQSLFSDPKMLTADDKKVFDRELKGLKLGSRLSLTNGARFNQGIWNVKQYTGYNGNANDLIVKILSSYPESSPEDADNLRFGEVKALHCLSDELVGAGVIEDPKVESVGLRRRNTKFNSLRPSLQNGKGGKALVPVVIMKKKRGQELPNTDAYKAVVKPGKKPRFMKLLYDVKKLACDAVALVAVEKGVFHGDRILPNILVTMTSETPTSVELIDWGIAYSVSKDVNKQEVANALDPYVVRASKTDGFMPKLEAKVFPIKRSLLSSAPEYDLIAALANRTNPHNEPLGQSLRQGKADGEASSTVSARRDKARSMVKTVPSRSLAISQDNRLTKLTNEICAGHFQGKRGRSRETGYSRTFQFTAQLIDRRAFALLHTRSTTLYTGGARCTVEP